MSKEFKFILFLILCLIELMIVLYIFACGIILSPLQKIIWTLVGLWVAIVAVRMFLSAIPPMKVIIDGTKRMIKGLGLLLIIAIGLMMLYVGFSGISTTMMLLLIIIFALID